MLILLTTGKLIKDPVKRTSSAGKTYCTALLSVPTDDGQALISAIAFTDCAEKLLAHHQGDTISVLGKGKLSTWERDGEQKHGLDMVVDRLLSPYEMGKRREALSEPQAKPPQQPVPEPAFNDDLPF